LIQVDIQPEQEVVHFQILIVLLSIHDYCNRFYVFKNKEKVACQALQWFLI
jgi:hypothetical protein